MSSSNDVINGVPRELLEHVVRNLGPHLKCHADLTALLAAQPQASAAQSAPDAPPCWWINHGSHGQITQREDEAQTAADEGKQVVRYTAAWQRTQSAGVPVAWFTDWPGHRVYAAEPHGFDEPGLHLSGDSIPQQWHPLYAAAPAQPAAQGLCNCPAGSKPEPHKHAPNCPYRTGAAAHDRGEVQRLREALSRIRDHAARVMDDEVFYEADSALATSTGQEVKHDA